MDAFIDELQGSRFELGVYFWGMIRSSLRKELKRNPGRFTALRSTHGAAPQWGRAFSVLGVGGLNPVDDPLGHGRTSHIYSTDQHTKCARTRASMTAA